jgi:hypothetical protein
MELHVSSAFPSASCLVAEDAGAGAICARAILRCDASKARQEEDRLAFHGGLSQDILHIMALWCALQEKRGVPLKQASVGVG